MNRLCKLITLCICLATISPVFAELPSTNVNVLLYGNVFLSDGTSANGATYNISVYDDGTGELLSTSTGRVGNIINDNIYESQNTPNSAGDIFDVTVVFSNEKREARHVITSEELKATVVNVPDIILLSNSYLTVTSISSSPNVPKVGEQIWINATISNSDGSSAIDFKAELLVDGISITNNTASVNSNSATIVGFTWDFTPGTHTITVRVNSGSERSITVKSGYDIALVNEWNLISIPLDQDNWSITSVLASIEGNYSSVLTYVDGVWEKSTAARNPLTEMGTKYGYWIYMTAPDTLELTGTTPPLTPIRLTAGWNLIGYPSLDTQNITTVLSQVNYSSVSKYVDGAWEKSTAARNPLTEMSPGYGYWVYEVDSTPPTWSQTLPDQVAEANLSFTYVVNASDNIAIGTYFINDTANFAIDTSGVITNNTVLLLGTYDLNISVSDTSNNILSTVITIPVLDTTSPVITIISPADGTTVFTDTGTVTINADITEPNPDTVILNLNGKNTSYATYSGQYTGTIKNVAAGGKYTFYVWANDSSGNVNVSETRSVTVDYTSSTNTDSLSIAFIGSGGSTAGENYVYVDTNINSGSAVVTSFIDWNRSLGGYWRFEDDAGSAAADSSTYGNSGTIYGAVSTGGKFGNALNFDGINDYVEIENPDLTLTDAVTIEAWIKPVLGNRGAVVARYNYGASVNDRSFVLSINSGGNVEFALNSNGIEDGTTWLNSSGRVSDGAWNHIVATSDGTTMQIYINDILDPATAPAPPAIYSPDRPIQIGAWIYSATSGTDNEYFNGIIDEVKIHSRALSPQEIDASYDSKLHSLERNFTSLEIGDYTYYACAQNAAGSYKCTETRNTQIKTANMNENPPPPPMGGDGDGGGGGGWSSGAKGASATVPVLKSGEAATFTFSDRESKFVSEIMLTSKQAHYNAKITVETFEDKPYASLPDPKGIAYKYLKITLSNLPITLIEDGDIKFKVGVRWLKEHDIDPSTVTLNRNVPERWDVLATTKTGSDENYVYYTAKTPGFSTFVISAEEGSGYLEKTVPVATQTSIATPKADVPTPTLPALTTPAATPPVTPVLMLPSSMPTTKTWLLLILIVIVGGYVLTKGRIRPR